MVGTSSGAVRRAVRFHLGRLSSADSASFLRTGDPEVREVVRAVTEACGEDVLVRVLLPVPQTTDELVGRLCGAEWPHALYCAVAEVYDEAMEHFGDEDEVAALLAGFLCLRVWNPVLVQRGGADGVEAARGLQKLANARGERLVALAKKLATTVVPRDMVVVRASRSRRRWAVLVLVGVVVVSGVIVMCVRVFL